MYVLALCVARPGVWLGLVCGWPGVWLGPVLGVFDLCCVRYVIKRGLDSDSL